MMNVIVPKLVWEGNAKLVKKLETIPMTAAKKIILGYSKTASNNTVLRAENWGCTHLNQTETRGN